MAVSKFDKDYKSALLSIIVYHDVLGLSKYKLKGRYGIYEEYRGYVSKIIKLLDFGIGTHETYSICLNVFSDLKHSSDMGYNLDDCYDMAEDISQLFAWPEST